MGRGGFAIAIFAAVIAALMFASAAQSLAKKLAGNRPATGNLVSLLDEKATARGNQRGVGLLQRAVASGQVRVALHDKGGL